MKKHASLLVVALALLAPSVSHADSACYANFMFILDRSCSMNTPPEKGETMTKWDYAMAAINDLVTAGSGQASFGLTFFPVPDGTSPDLALEKCGFTGPVEVPISASSGSAISTAMTQNTPGQPLCSTPVVPGIMQAGTESHLASQYASGDRTYAILITDGAPTCGETQADIVAAIQALYMRGYPTFVVGFGGQVNAEILNAAAIAGGVPRTSFVDDAGQPYDGGDVSYYQADSGDSLAGILQSILGTVTGEFSSCVGTPCPDGRCYVAGQTCQGGFCAEPPSTDFAVAGGGGGGGEDASAVADGGDTTAGKKNAGCGCEVGGRPVVAPSLLLLAIAAVVLLRRRRAV